MHAPTLSINTQASKTRFQRVLMLFVLVFMALQLIGAGSHTHSYTGQSDDCAACVVAHMPAGVPPAAAVVAPMALLVSLSVIVPTPGSRVPSTKHLTPPSHAPPGVAAVSF